MKILTFENDIMERPYFKYLPDEAFGNE